MDVRTAFSTLGLDETASAEAVRDAYRDLVKIWHPDRFPGDPRVQAKADDMMRAINAAYDVALAFAMTPPPAAPSDPAQVQAPPGRATAARSTRRASGGPNMFFFRAVIISGLGLLLMAALAPWSPLASESRARLDDVAASMPRLWPVPTVTIPVSTPSELATVVEGTWLLEGWLFDFRQGAIYVRGEQLPIGYYDPETSQILIYREGSTNERVAFDVELTKTTMQWYTGRGEQRRLVHEFRRVT